MRSLVVVCVGVIGLSDAVGSARGVLTRAPGVVPGLVDIDVTLGLQGARSAGMGIVLSGSGAVLTNNDVIRGATAITVVDLSDGHSYAAAIVGYSLADDVAVLRLGGASGLRAARQDSRAPVRIGEKVTAVGDAPSGGAATVAAGEVTGLNRSLVAGTFAGATATLTGLVRTNAPLPLERAALGARIVGRTVRVVGYQPASGGPLLDPAGRVIGIDTAASEQPASGYAIPIARADAVAEAILGGHASETIHVGATAFLGVSVPNPLPGLLPPAPRTRAGAEVESVVSGSAARRAGLAAGDTITSLDGHDVTSAAALLDSLLAATPGETVPLRWDTPDGSSHGATVRLASGPPQ